MDGQMTVIQGGCGRYNGRSLHCLPPIIVVPYGHDARRRKPIWTLLPTGIGGLCPTQPETFPALIWWSFLIIRIEEKRTGTTSCILPQ
jgi:hypothetical protein